MKKKKKLFIVIGILLLLVLSALVSVAFSNLLLIGLAGNTEKIDGATSLLSVTGILEQEEQRNIFLLSLLMCGVAVLSLFFLGKNKETFESDTATLTDKITTPVAIGQGQYGTARWLKKEERKKTYNRLVIDPKDKELQRLLILAKEETNKLFREAKRHETL